MSSETPLTIVSAANLQVPGDFPSSGQTLLEGQSYQRFTPLYCNLDMANSNVRAVLEDYFSVSKHTTTPVQAYWLEDVVSVGSGVLATARGAKLVAETCEDMAPHLRQRLFDRLHSVITSSQGWDGLLAAAHKVEKPAVFLRKMGDRNLGHWIAELFPIALLLTHIGLPEEVLIAVPEVGGTEILKQRVQSMSSIGVPTRRLLAVTDGPVLFRRLLYITPISRWLPPSSLAPAAAAMLDNYTAAQVGEGCGPKERLFIRRAPARARRLLNREEVESEFERHGFRVLEIDHLSFLEKVRLLRSTSFVAGTFGQDLASCAFMCPGTQALVLRPPNLQDTFFENLFSVKRMPYATVFGGQPDPASEDIDIDLRHLQTALSCLEEGVAPPS